MISLIRAQVIALNSTGDTAPKVLINSQQIPSLPDGITGHVEHSLNYKAVVLNYAKPYIEGASRPTIKAAIEALPQATVEFASLLGYAMFFTASHHAWELPLTGGKYQIVPFEVFPWEQPEVGGDLGEAMITTQAEQGTQVLE
ncbi:hypothetical protein B0A55_02210 [Friedmanniomyces simplex]|uniref:Uncharacterized protein n=1 Tax=Friedmanniomyces simplex TaxID=329884 RepID=A0A4U0XRV9_9PEZI|nr:hypothetical protein B0A55_02210 [Friedmanniomyces simplex]